MKHPERHLEGWLSKNLNTIEGGLVLIKRQYRYSPYKHAPDRRNVIDILAVDANGVFVIIEVKIRISSWAIDTQIKDYLDTFPKPCRGIVVGIKISKNTRRMEVPKNIKVVEVGKQYEIHRNKKLG